MRRIIYILLLITIACSLLNSNAFGSDSLIAYFFFSLSALTASICYLFTLLAGHSAKFLYKPPTYVLPLALLVIYVWVDGTLRDSIGLAHYYWLVLFIILNIVYQLSAKYQEHGLANKIYSGVIVIALLESILVLLQCIRIIDTPSQYFLCTGSWGNPNVTAIFLSLSLYALLKQKKSGNPLLKKKWVHVSCLAVILLSILLLNCRTAYITTFVLLVMGNYSYVQALTKKYVRLNAKAIAIAFVIIAFLVTMLSSVLMKKASAVGRLQIWQTSLELIYKKPMLGYGFGQYEKEYNSYSAAKNLPVNDHVFMAYNDFIELSVEGGLLALILWLSFYYLLFRFALKKSGDALLNSGLILSFFVIQMINFGVIAIPAMALFILFVALMGNDLSPKSANETVNGKAPVLPLSRGLVKGIAATSLVALLFLFSAISTVMKGLYRQQVIEEAHQIRKSIPQYRMLGSILHGYASYHEAYGTSYLNLGQYRPALAQFEFASRKSCTMDLLTKTAYCYQMLGSVDTSEYYYRLAAQMQPHRFLPKLYLLKLYEQRHDTIAMLREADAIVASPVKIRNEKSYQIKYYASHLIDSLKGLPIHHTSQQPTDEK